MTDKEKSINDALNDIFGDDFLEFETNDKSEDDNKDLGFNINTNDIESNNDKNIVFEDYDISDKDINSNDIKNDEVAYETNSINNEENVDINNTTYNNSKDLIDIKSNDTMIEVSNNSNKKSKKYIMYIIIAMVFIVLIVLSIIKLNTSFEKKEYCYYETKDEGYSLTDEYTISYKGNKLLYIEGTYVYNALNDEYKSQIEYIKDEKLPVIVNSNGMSGFTHIYEIGEDTLKISSYYDILSIDFSLVNKNDNKSNPISYVNLKSNTTYKDLKEDLEKNGYKCTPSK